MVNRENCFFECLPPLLINHFPANQNQLCSFYRLLNALKLVYLLNMGLLSLAKLSGFFCCWFSLATQTQPIGMTQVKMKFDGNKSTSKIIGTFQTVRRKVIWIHIFIGLCSISFSLVAAQTQAKAKAQEKRKIWILGACPRWKNN